MFQRLKEKWGLSWLRFILVFTTFALGGSLCGYAGRQVLGLIELDKGVLYYLLYVVLVTLLWPLCVLVVSIPMGQFAFFRNYLLKMKRRVMGKGRSASEPVATVAVAHVTPSADPQVDHSAETPAVRKRRIAIFASGAGSNARKIVEHLRGHARLEVVLVVCNKPGAGVIGIAAEQGVPVLMIEKENFFRGNAYLDELRFRHQIDLIVLAGFLWKVPAALVEAYPGRIVNIHPALLPKYGGKGMYGHHVHAAVIAAGETESGITIHLVNERYDEGAILFQAHCSVEPSDTPDTLAQKIHTLEHAHFPGVVEEWALNN